MFDYSDFMNYTPCMHRRVEVEASGARSFSEGEVFDDIQERLVCLDCGEYVTEVEVRAYWGKVPASKQESSDGNA